MAFDLGKYKSVVCVLDAASGEYRFASFDTSRAELPHLLAKEKPDVVVIEACLLAGWVHDRCDERGVRWLVAIYLRLTGGGQRRRKQAIVALARKMPGALLGHAV